MQEINQTPVQPAKPKWSYNWLIATFAFVILVAVVLYGIFYFLGDKNGNETADEPVFVPVSLEFADNNFNLTADNQDRLGVAKDTQFTLTSEEPITENVVEKSLSVTPQVEFAVQEINANEFKIVPAVQLEDGGVYQFKVATAVNTEAGANEEQGREYSWAYQIKTPLKIVHTLPGDKTTSVPSDSGIEITFSTDTFYDFEKYFEISPSVEGTFEQHKRTMVFVPKQLESEKLYQVKIKAGLPFNGTDNVLEEDYVFQFETSDNSGSASEQYFNFSKTLNSFDSVSEPVFEVYNFPQGTEREFVLYQFESFDQFKESFNSYLTYPGWAYYARRNQQYSVDDLTEVMRFSAAPEEYSYNNYLVFPESIPAGYYIVQTIIDGQPVQSWVQVSNQSAFSTVSETKTLVWVNNVDTHGPVAGATVSLSENDLSATTDIQGVAFFGTPDILKTANPDKSYYFTITGPGGEQIIIPATSEYGYYRYSDWNGENNTTQFWDYLYLDRPIYQKTDTVKFWGLAKPRDGQDQPSNITVKLNGYDYQPYSYEQINIAEANVAVNASGTYIGEFSFSNLEPGYYTLNVFVGEALLSTKQVYVEEYVKPHYTLSATSEKKVMVIDEPNNINIKSEFFDGTVVPNIETSYGSMYGSGSVTTDESGNASFQVTPTAQYDNPHTDYVTISSSGAENAEISTSLKYKIFNSDIWLDVETDTNNETATINTDLHYLDFAAMNADDYDIWSEMILSDPVANHQITGKIKKVIYDKVETGQYYDFINKVTRKTYSYNRHADPIQDVNITTDEQGNADYSFTMEDDQEYEIDLQYTDFAGRTIGLTRGIWNGINYYSSSDTNLSLQNTDDKEYLLNEQANFSLYKQDVTLPVNVPGNSYLYYQAKLGLLNYSVEQDPDYSFTFQEQNIPNTYVNGVWFDGKNYETSNQYYYDNVQAVFDSKNQVLDLQVTADKARYEPGEDVVLTVNTKNVDAQPVSAKVNLNLVDEAIYSLREDVANPISEIYESVSSGIYQTYVSHEKVSYDLAAERGGCFVQGTPILMADGTTKPIEQIKENDRILTRSSENNSEMVPAHISKTFEHLVDEYLIINGTLEITPNHILWVNGSWQSAESIKIGDWLLNANNERVMVETINKKVAPVFVYNLSVDQYHTFIASNIYVHNDKGDARKNFQDAILFTEVETNNQGRATVKFTLPDDITSWRVTAQAISDNLQVGLTTEQIPVSLPFFVETNLAKEYLVGDRPTIELLAYGDGLSNGDVVEFKLKNEALGLDETVDGTAFNPTEINLPIMPEGDYEIVVSGKINELEDAIVKKTSVVESHWQHEKVSFSTLSENISIPGNTNGQTTLQFMDKNRGYFYRDLMGLYYSWGERVDQSYAKYMAASLMNSYFGDQQALPEFDGGLYQRSDGGIGILPYSSSEILLSANLAGLAPDEFDRSNLTNYFNLKLADNGAGLDEVVWSLYGLANLGEPVLNSIIDVLKNQSVNNQQSLYLALGLERLGAGEYARTVYKKIISETAEEFDAYLRIKIGEDEDDYLQYTMLAALLASRIGEEGEEQLFSYVRDNWPEDILINIEKLMYLQSAIPKLPNEPVSFNYTVGDRSEDVALQKAERYAVSVSNEELADLSFTRISGTVGVISYYQELANPETITVDPQIAINRTYSVIGRTDANRFSEGDIVKITLNGTINPNAIDDAYQVTDYVPAGLAIVSRPYQSMFNGDFDSSWPYKIDGQKISFLLWKTWNKPIVYYARVRNKGVFRAEPAMIQGFQAKSSINMLFESSQIEID
ncbi:MAG: alpha-2-macroglobulin family protein [Patescibacteria group bacterium]